MEHIEPPYADLVGVLKGEKQARTHRRKIVFNEHSEVFEFEGADRISIIDIKYNWPTMMQDMNKASKFRMRKEKNRLLGLESDELLEINGVEYNKAYFHKHDKGRKPQRHMNKRRMDYL